MSAASTELRAHLIAALRADAQLAALLGGAKKVFDVVPERTAAPYVKLRESNRAWDTTTDYGKQHEIEVNVFCEAKPDAADGVIREGRKKAEAIVERIQIVFRALWPATLSAHRLVNLVFVTADVRDDTGGKSQLGYARFRAVTEEI